MVVVMIIIMVMVAMYKWSACTTNSWLHVRLPKANAIAGMQLRVIEGSNFSKHGRRSSGAPLSSLA